MYEVPINKQPNLLVEFPFTSTAVQYTSTIRFTGIGSTGVILARSSAGVSLCLFSQQQRFALSLILLKYGVYTLNVQSKTISLYLNVDALSDAVLMSSTPKFNTDASYYAQVEPVM